MADLLNLKVLGIFLFYVVPGVVATKVYSSLIPTDRKNYADYVVELITFSMFYLALFFWLVALVNSATIQSNAILYNVLVLLTVFIIPAALGWIGSALAQAAWVRRLVGTVTHPMPSAWDYIFSRGETYWIRFHLKTGEKVGGYYGPKSFASAYPQTPELYVQELWRLDKEGRFVEMDSRSAGGYIKFEDCQVIEFLSEV